MTTSRVSIRTSYAGRTSHLQRGIDPSPFEGFIPPFGRLDLDQNDNGADGTAAGGKGGMNPSKGEGSIPRCSLYARSIPDARIYRFYMGGSMGGGMGGGKGKGECDSRPSSGRGGDPFAVIVMICLDMLFLANA